MAQPAPAPLTTRDRLLDAAEELFATAGFGGSSVRELAARVGITPASLYNHFRSKQDLYEAVLERGVRPLIELLADAGSQEGQTAAAAATADPADSDAEGQVIDAVMAHLARHPFVPRLVYHEAVRGGEYLAPLARSWIRPLLFQGVAAVERAGEGPWDKEEAPLVIAAWLHLVFGTFATAPLMREIVDHDPLSPAALERQTRFLRKLARLMRGAPASGA